MLDMSAPSQVMSLVDLFPLGTSKYNCGNVKSRIFDPHSVDKISK